LDPHALRVIKNIIGIILPFDFLKKTEISKIEFLHIEQFASHTSGQGSNQQRVKNFITMPNVMIRGIEERKLVPW
jgi:hypothetical protein